MTRFYFLLIAAVRIDVCIAYLPGSELGGLTSSASVFQQLRGQASDFALHPAATDAEDSAHAEDTAQPSWQRFGVGVALGLIVALTQVGGSARAAGGGEWSYPPESWTPTSYPMCRGGAQSPVNLSGQKTSVSNSMASSIKYSKLDKLSIFNEAGKKMQVNGSFGSLALPDGEYKALQFHFHFPSEHTIDGKQAAGEMHIVHAREMPSGEKSLAVLGVLLQETSERGASQEELEFFGKLGFNGQLPKDGDKVALDSVDLNALKKEFEGGYYHYVGSLTTPPCSEEVHWYVLAKPASVTREMIDTWKKVATTNFRSPQKLNGRAVVNDLSVTEEYSRVSL